MSDRDERPRIVAIVGPTGVGKTRLAVELCERLGGEIVGADSVQVYRGFDIGSNKPSAEELRGVPHHLIDVLDPPQPIDAADYARRADQIIGEVAARGRVPVVAGGTGLWLRALLRGLVELPKVDPELRAALEHEFHARGDELHARLTRIDPLTAERVHPSDMVRVVRALEVHAQTGRALGELRREHALGASRYPAYTLSVDVPLPDWRRAVTERTARLLELGFVDEVRGLVERYGTAPRALRAVGYRQIHEGLERGLDPSLVGQRVLAATLVYGRRQRNWFRTDPAVTERTSPDELLSPERLEALRRHLAPDH